MLLLMKYGPAGFQNQVRRRSSHKMRQLKGGYNNYSNSNNNNSNNILYWVLQDPQVKFYSRSSLHT